MNTDKLLGMLLEAIDYSFLQIDGSYDKSLTYPVIDKVKYIKEKLKNKEGKEVDLDEMLTEFISRYAYENGGEYPSAIDIDIAHRLFELGLKAEKKGE